MMGSEKLRSYKRQRDPTPMIKFFTNHSIHRRFWFADYTSTELFLLSKEEGGRLLKNSMLKYYGCIAVEL